MHDWQQGPGKDTAYFSWNSKAIVRESDRINAAADLGLLRVKASGTRRSSAMGSCPYRSGERQLVALRLADCRHVMHNDNEMTKASVMC